MNSAGKGHFKLMVDTPQIHTYTINPTWQVDELIIKPTSIVA